MQHIFYIATGLVLGWLIIELIKGNSQPIKTIVRTSWLLFSSGAALCILLGLIAGGFYMVWSYPVGVIQIGGALAIGYLPVVFMGTKLTLFPYTPLSKNAVDDPEELNNQKATFWVWDKPSWVKWIHLIACNILFIIYIFLINASF